VTKCFFSFFFRLVSHFFFVFFHREKNPVQFVSTFMLKGLKKAETLK